VAVEHKKGYSSANQNFANTSVDLVRSKMLHPENCIFRPGRFPQTAEGIEDRFALSVSMPIYMNRSTRAFTTFIQGLKKEATSLSMTSIMADISEQEKRLCNIAGKMILVLFQCLTVGERLS
jgi:hypothetical protein